MPLPTLMIKGSLVAIDGLPETKAMLDTYTPIDYILEWFDRRLNLTGVVNRVLILRSETASGKSTSLPPEICKRFVFGGGTVPLPDTPGVICTQPRVLTAMENVMEMLKHYSSFLRLRETIGWSTKNNKLRPKSVGLLSATIGTLNQQLKTMTDVEVMNKYKFILIDETHERDLTTDVTILMLKNLLIRCKDNPRCPFVVLMSATFDPDDFLKYFDIPKLTNYIWCKGSSSQIKEMWDWNQGRTVNNYPQAAADVVKQICLQNTNDDFVVGADMLIFLPGAGEFEETEKYLIAVNEELAKAGGDVFSIIKIESEAISKVTIEYRKLIAIPLSAQIQTFNGKQYIPKRRCILSTNVAETGLTLEGLKYSIDAGFNREVEFNPIYGVSALLTKPAPQSRIRQRRGRVGRKFDGVFYPLYPQHIHDALPPLQFPAILVNDVTPIMLDLINEQLKTKRMSGSRDPNFELSAIDMINPPSGDSLLFALEKMYALGYISPMAPEWDGSIVDHFADRLSERAKIALTPQQPRYSMTDLGLLAAPLIGMTMTPETTRMVLASYNWNVATGDMLTIAAWLTTGQIVAKSKDKKVKLTVDWVRIYKDSGIAGGNYNKLRLLIGDEFIDGVILFTTISNIVGDHVDGRARLIKYCALVNLQYDAVIAFIDARDELIESFILAEYVFNDGEHIANAQQSTFMDLICRIKHCIYDGYRLNMIVRDTDGKYYGPRQCVVATPPSLFDNPALAIKAMPKYVCYQTLNLRLDKKSGAYIIGASRISILDGFVSPDIEFLL